MRFQAPRGTEDVLPNDSHRWHRLESIFQTVSALYGYREVRTPTFEDTQLFLRTSGETSDIVTKQMYTFKDKGDRDITLKPEGTAPVMRALIEAGMLTQGQTLKVSYNTPFFRYERPQKGRLREAHQFGLEYIGSQSPLADAEVIEATIRFYREIGLTQLSVELNSLGREQCRANYRNALLEFVRDSLSLEPDEQSKVEKNPLRLLDSKAPDVIEKMRSAPPISEFWEPECADRFAQVQEALRKAEIPFQVSPSIVRGLDYYTETVFEVHQVGIGAQSALCGGGRYDNLIKELGGPAQPSVGVGMGVERALLALEAMEIEIPAPNIQVMVIAASDEHRNQAMAWARMLRNQGVSCEIDLDGKSMKSQLKSADRLCASFAWIIGDDEAQAGKVTVRNMSTSEQTLMDVESAVQAAKA